MSINAFTPGSLMEGYTHKEMLKGISDAADALRNAFGNDREASCVALCFLLGREIRNSRVPLEMAIPMVVSAVNIK